MGSLGFSTSRGFGQGVHDIMVVVVVYFLSQWVLTVVCLNCVYLAYYFDLVDYFSLPLIQLEVDVN